MSLAVMSLAIPAAEAALFTGGCAAIHALRRQADGVTLALSGILAILVLLVGIAITPAVYLATRTDGILAETGIVPPSD